MGDAIINRRWLMTLAASCCAEAAVAAANPACVPIASAPYEIRSPGLYCLAGNLTYATGSGAAILILTDDATVDLNGFSIAGTGGSGTFATGVFAQARRGITIRNGTIRGFLYGILLGDDGAQGWAQGGGHLLRDLQLVRNYFRGIRVEGRADVVERCRIADTGGTTVFGAGNYAFGVEVFGPGTQILSNVIDRTVAGAGGEAVGVSVSDGGSGVVVEGNVISNEALPATANSFGVWVGGGSSVLLLDNRFARLSFGADRKSVV